MILKLNWEIQETLPQLQLIRLQALLLEVPILFGIFDITGDIRIRFKQHFDRLMKARNYTFDEMCFSVVVDICSLGGNIKISTVKNFIMVLVVVKLAQLIR
ncbi:unnamed protein product [Rhizophagus irregularis]|nr:unnamed protein product [Rhizophagus irregularis]